MTFNKHSYKPVDSSEYSTWTKSCRYCDKVILFDSQVLCYIYQIPVPLETDTRVIHDCTGSYKKSKKEEATE